MKRKCVEQFERETLEALDQLEKLERVTPTSKAIIRWEYLRSHTSFGSAATMASEFFSYLEMLSEEGMIELLRTHGDIGVSITPKGRKRLLMTDEEHQGRVPSNVHITNTFHAPVGQFAQATGFSPSVRQNQKALDHNVLSLVDRLVREIGNGQTLPRDARSEAEQLRIEVGKEHPLKERVISYLDRLKLLSGGVRSVTQLIEDIHKFVR